MRAKHRVRLQITFLKKEIKGRKPSAQQERLAENKLKKKNLKEEKSKGKKCPIEEKGKEIRESRKVRDGESSKGGFKNE